jgi:4-hydroxy-4-methyl-2-oxoglutarate aldolase
MYEAAACRHVFKNRGGGALRTCQLRPAAPGMRMCGGVLPVRHVDSVEVFLEVFEKAPAGDVPVVESGGRLDEACVGDLVTLEARNAGLAGIVIWGFTATAVRYLKFGFPCSVSARLQLAR